jgi:hypothetical protein
MSRHSQGNVEHIRLGLVTESPAFPGRFTLFRSRRRGATIREN